MSEWRARSTPKTLAHLNHGEKCEDMARHSANGNVFFFSIMSAKKERDSGQCKGDSARGRERERESDCFWVFVKCCKYSTGYTHPPTHCTPLHFIPTNSALFSGCQVKCASEAAMAVRNLHAVQRTNEQNKLRQGGQSLKCALKKKTVRLMIASILTQKSEYCFQYRRKH